MVNLFKIFCIRREERLLALVALLVFVALNGLMAASEWKYYTEGAPGGFWTLFVKRFTMSGYDCWSWLTVSGMRIHFETIRHPLYLTFLYPMYLLNHWQMGYTDVNLAVFMIGGVLVFSAVYSAIFVYRLLREVVGVSHGRALLLVALLFSFGHVMIPPMVPDHFAISMLLLTMTAYVAGKRMLTGRRMGAVQQMLLLFFTSGIAASNGAKTMLAALFVNGRGVFRPRYVAVAFVLPLALLLAIRQYQYHALEVPQSRAIAKIERSHAAKQTATARHKVATHRQWVEQHDIRHAGDDGLLYLMDFSTPRVPAVVENFLGESILLHRDYALMDVFRNRPMIVEYRHAWEYGVVALVVAFFVAGAWAGRRSRMMQMLLCWLSFDVLLNLVLGFAINEVYIMASGWIFIIPIATGYLLGSLPRRAALPLELVVGALALLLWVHNGLVVVNHLFPVGG